MRTSFNLDVSKGEYERARIVAKSTGRTISMLLAAFIKSLAEQFNDDKNVDDFLKRG